MAEEYPFIDEEGVETKQSVKLSAGGEPEYLSLADNIRNAVKGANASQNFYSSLKIELANGVKIWVEVASKDREL